MTVVQRHLNRAGILAGVIGIEGREIVHHADIGHHHFEIMGTHYAVNQVLHLLDVLFGHFNARSGGDLHVDGELAGVGARKECHAQNG
jgi:hypothetical protein